MGTLYLRLPTGLASVRRSMPTAPRGDSVQLLMQPPCKLLISFHGLLARLGNVRSLSDKPHCTIVDKLKRSSRLLKRPPYLVRPVIVARILCIKPTAAAACLAALGGHAMCHVPRGEVGCRRSKRSRPSRKRTPQTIIEWGNTKSSGQSHKISVRFRTHHSVSMHLH